MHKSLYVFYFLLSVGAFYALIAPSFFGNRTMQSFHAAYMGYERENWNLSYGEQDSMPGKILYNGYYKAYGFIGQKEYLQWTKYDSETKSYLPIWYSNAVVPLDKIDYRINKNKMNHLDHNVLEYPGYYNAEIYHKTNIDHRLKKIITRGYAVLK